MSASAYNFQLDLESIVTITVTQILCSEKYVNLIADKIRDRIQQQLDKRLEQRDALLGNRVKYIEERLERSERLSKKKSISFVTQKNESMDSKDSSNRIDLSLERDVIRGFYGVEMVRTNLCLAKNKLLRSKIFVHFSKKYNCHFQCDKYLLM